MKPEMAIEARGLTKRFGELTAVDALDLDVPRGRIYGFLGPNGSGKSTSIRMLCGLLTPSAGTANVLGVSIPGSTDALKPKIGYMTQSFSLFVDMTVVENLQFIAAIYSYPQAERKQRIDELLERYNLTAKRNALAGTLSGGQRQYLALACAVLHHPELLLLDEPTSAVDPQSRRNFWSNLFRLAKAGTTILLSTHYMDEAERCHRLAILARGVKVADGTPDELQHRTGMHVIEVIADDPYAAQTALSVAPEIASVTQLGMRLRALLPERIVNPEAVVDGYLEREQILARTRRVEASLEDVFVAATLPRQERAA
jgi:ABC-2 type transport system ATP-binding protein